MKKREEIEKEKREREEKGKREREERGNNCESFCSHNPNTLKKRKEEKKK